MHGRLHNVYVTPDGKYAVMGSIPKKLITVVDLATEQIAWELKLDLGRPADDDRDQRRRLDQAHLRRSCPTSTASRWSISPPARKSPRSSCRTRAAEFETDSDRATAPSHGIGVAPDRKTLWVTSIPNNAVYVYSLADLSLIGHVDLPDLKLPGHKPLSAVANWVTFTPDGKMVYISNASLRSVTAIDTKAMKVVADDPGRRGAEADQHDGDELSGSRRSLRRHRPRKRTIQRLPRVV